MDTRNGAIFDSDEVKSMLANDPAFKERIKHLKEMAMPPTERQRKQMKVGRNDPCPCDSGKKFKKCCLNAAGDPEEKLRAAFSDLDNSLKGG